MRGRKISMDRIFAVYDFIIDYKQAHDGNSPGVGKIAEHINSTRSKAWATMLRLERDGMIRLGEGHCSIEVIGGSWSLADPFTTN